MPPVAFVTPTGKLLSFEEAPRWFELNTDWPAEVVYLLCQRNKDDRRMGVNLSPSGASPDTTCPRQLLIKKFFDYAVDPMSTWSADEGTIWHDQLERVGQAMEEDDQHSTPWLREVLVPDEIMTDYEHPKVREFQYTPTHVSKEVELFDGIWMNGKIDKLRDDFEVIEDYKTKAWPWGPRKNGIERPPREYPISRDWILQLNCYRRMVEVVTGVNPRVLRVRRLYKGARLKEYAWKKLDVPVISNDELEASIRPHVENFVKLATRMAELKTIEERIEFLKFVPLTGKEQGMFRGKKCSLYCEQMPICFDLAGLVRFESAPNDTKLVQIVEAGTYTARGTSQ